MDDLRDEKVIEPLLENIKRRNHINLLRRLDDKYFLLEDFIMDDTLPIVSASAMPEPIVEHKYKSCNGIYQGKA